jgi:cell division septum initiation protein DivIVA
VDNSKDDVTPSPLTKAQIDTVRFQVTKPGYAFAQVEAFVEKVRSTLEFLEKEMKKDKIALAESQDEIELLTERAQTLSATLEIFKVKGDAIVNPDGEYLTESQVQKAQKLEEENKYLREQLRISQEDANAGWEAEAELRKYIETELLPWLNKNKEDIVNNIDSEKAALTEDADIADVSSITFDEDLEHAEHIQIDSENTPTISSDNEFDWFK